MHAQAIISEALDRSPVEARILAEAKAHCKTCAECGRFVRTLAAMQRTEAPRPPADLADRVMDALVIEIARERAETRKPVSEPSDASTPLPDVAPASLERIRQRLRDPRARRQFFAWGSAAAVVFIAAGVFAVSGVRTILVPEDSARQSGGMTYDTASVPEAAKQESASLMATGTVVAAATAPEYVVFEGTVYRLTGPSAGIDPSALQTLGTVTSALGSTDAPRARKVLGNRSDLSRIHVEDDKDGAYLAFDRVTRTFGERTYALQAQDVTGFSQWPQLPATMSPPLSEDGSPTFAKVEEGVFRLASATVEQGIAIPPGTDSSDPAAGNPGWTWWTPLR